jgi:phage head maturation protease
LPLVEVAKAWVELNQLSLELRQHDLGFRCGVCEVMPTELFGFPNLHSPLGQYLNALLKAGVVKRDSKRISGVSDAKILEGWACLYDVPHSYKGRTEIFQKGCFAGTLYGVFFAIDHKYITTRLGDQDSNTLELLDSDVGLAYRLKLTGDALERLDGRCEASVSYIEKDVVVKDGVRTIRAAALFDISACHIATMRGTHCSIRDAAKVGTLAYEVKHNFSCEAASTKFLRSLRQLDNS